MAEVLYDESKIRTLNHLEHIRLRPGMYIGRMGNGAHADDGIYILLKEVLDNAVDEFIMGHGRKVVIELGDERASVRDYGRGIPLGKVVECVSQINTGAKFSDDVFQFSVGLNGVGTKAVNALSQHFEVISTRAGRAKRAVFARGALVEEVETDSDEADGTLVIFEPDPELFGKYKFAEALVKRRIWNYAYLNSGLSLWLNGERIHSRDGLYDLLREKCNGSALYDIVHHRDKQLEFAFCHTNEFGENYYSFVNGQYTNDGGTHQSAFREGLLKGINDFARKNHDPDDVRNGIFGAIAIKLQEPIFESQTKNKLGNSEIRSELVKEVQQAVMRYLHRNPTTAEAVMDKIGRNEKMRKEIQAVRKASKEKSKKIALKIPKLKDCKFHRGDKERGDESMIFLAEGDSAVGPMVSARDPSTQAVFGLKGKPLNCYGKKRSLMVSNDEFFYLMKALNIEDGVEGLRYEKVIIATDADDDGMHIRNLLLTFFLYYFKDLILSEHLYILETPLFRVRDKKHTIYCFDADERDAAVRQIGPKRAEITRFKGLGEISPSEFGQFIGSNMRIIQVTIDKINEVPELLEFFMGSNTPERRDFIMQHLI